ncbi:MAG: LemA family protein [Pseudobdellovibrionaceae bacterium]|nr:LemA family protein [Pseudobdellovibrionaceae bacterium]
MDQGLVILFSFLDVTIPFIIIYNKLVRARNYVKNAFAQIDVQLTRRYDLIPNLVESVKAYMKHERATLEAVIQARNQALQSVKTAGHNPADAQKIEQLSQAESNLNRAMGSFFALFEQYPDLKANTTINQLMEELISTKTKLHLLGKDLMTW